MDYLHWNQKTITDFSDDNVAAMYSNGYVFTRLGKGIMQQTRSVRIDLLRFEVTSENRRIMKKSGVFIVPSGHYNWEIGKMAKDFYDTKFETGIMSANKIKEVITDTAKSNFNYLIGFCTDNLAASVPIGYAICYKNSELLHYSYPFYNLNKAPKDMGLGMMTNAIGFAKQNGIRYVYLGSIQRPNDTYKLQFEGLEWFDGTKWQTDIEQAKQVLSTLQTLRTL